MIKNISATKQSEIDKQNSRGKHQTCFHVLTNQHDERNSKRFNYKTWAVLSTNSESLFNIKMK